MPEALTERGLFAAAGELTDRMPIPTELHLHDEGAALPEHVESSCYFVISEALANAVKHAHAQELVVALEHAAGNLRIEVRDDGVGGACTGGGSGLRGIADRVDSLNGRLTVDSPSGCGTRIIAEVPCAS